ncbi:MAG: peptidylprolyl isomerase, partial [Odoribacter sp.]|nr:peptidylprolyl isomerase [Odoribacter sp.]
MMLKRFFFFGLVSLLLWGCRPDKSVVVRMETSLGNIRFRLYDDTPIHRENMVKLVREGYYDGMLFHRVIRDFMIQTGDPASKTARPGMLLGDGDAGYTMEAEIRSRYFHKRGVVAAARESDNINPERRSSGSHFYIVQGKNFASGSLDSVVERINNNRYVALFNRLKAEREGEIMKYQLAEDYENLMRINREVSDKTRERFEEIKLSLSEEQIKAYT